MKVVSRYYDISPDQLVTKKRSRDISHPRQVAMYLCRELTDMSLPKIGQVFGGRDHTTVMHACEKIQDAIDHIMILEGQLWNLREILPERFSYQHLLVDYAVEKGEEFCRKK